MPVSLGSTSLFSGSQSLTTSLADVSGSTHTLDPANYTVPGGRTLQYRITGTVSGVPGFGAVEYWWENTTTDARELGALAANAVPPAAIAPANAVSLVTSPFSGYGLAVELAGTGSVGSASGLYLGFGVLDVTSPFTIDLTIQRGRTGTAEVLIGQWDSGATSYLLYIDGSDKLNFGWNQSGFQNIGGSGASMNSTSTRYDCRVVFDGSSLHLYLNGTRIATASGALTNSSVIPLWVGRDADGSSTLFQGIVDELHISDTARSTGSSYTPHTTPQTADGNTVLLQNFDLVAHNMATDWIPAPASSTEYVARVRNRNFTSGTVTAIAIEARHVDSATNTEFVKYGSNPVLERGASSTWEWGDVAAPPIFLDKHETDPEDWRWVMAYAGNDGGDEEDPDDAGIWHLGLAYKPYDSGSPTLGLLETEASWTKEVTNPVFSPNDPTEGYIACNGNIVPRLEEGDWIWYHFYNGAADGGTGDFQVFAASSDDYGLTWTRLNGGAKILTLGSGEQVGDPQVLLEDDGETFAMYYCRDGGGYITRNIWRARSTDPSDFDGDNKIFCPIPAYAVDNMGTPNPGYVDGELRITHDSADPASSSERYVAEIRTDDDGATFRYRRARLLPGSGGGDWDRGQAFDSVWALNGNEIAGDPIVLTYAGSVISDYVEGMFSELGEATAAREEASDSDTEMASSLAAAASVTSALSTAIQFASSLAAAATLTAALSTSIPLASSLSASATQTAALTTTIQFASSLSGAATVTADLTAGSTLASSLSAAASVTAALTTSIQFATALSGAASISATLAGTGATFESALSASGTVTAALTTAIPLATSLSGAATQTAALTTAIQFASSLSATGTLTAALEGTVVQFATALEATGTLTADLSTAIRFASAQSGTATVTAAMDTAIVFASSLSGTATLTATFQPPILADVTEFTVRAPIRFFDVPEV